MNDNEIIKTKKEIKFYIKESAKYFAIFTLTYIKQIVLLILDIINSFVPLAVLLLLFFSSATVGVSLITMLYCVITHIVIKKKLDNYVFKQFINDLTQISKKVNNAGYNLGKAYRKLKKLQKSNVCEEEIVINTDIVKNTEEIKPENKEPKYSYNYTNSHQPKDNYTDEPVKRKHTKKLTKNNNNPQ